MSRTKNSIRNVKYAMIGQMVTFLVNFVTRMVFLHVLNAEYLGLNGLFSNILSILSFAELGVGSAIIFSMYKPLAEKDEYKLKALMNVYKKTYSIIGSVILIMGIALTPFLDFFVKDMPDIPNIRLIYIIFVLNSGLSYFFSYKRSFLIADQNKYIESLYHYSFLFLRNVLQIAVLLLTKSFLLFLVVMLVSTLIENIAISKKTERIYPFLKHTGDAALERSERAIIVKNVKALILHKMGSVIVKGTDNILISIFVGIVQVGLYSNYILLINGVKKVYRLIFQSITASIGNLGATEDKEKNERIFFSIDLFGFWFFAFASICMINLFNPFIRFWLGEKYLFPMPIVYLIVLSFFLTGRRSPVLTFRDALGLFWYDRYKPVFESVINLLASILLAKAIGFEGVILGTIISTLTTCFWIEPYILFKYGFFSSVRKYFFRYGFQVVVLGVVGYVTWLICNLLPEPTFLYLLGRFTICLVVPNTFFLLIFWRTAELQYLIKIAKKMLKKKSLINK